MVVTPGAIGRKARSKGGIVTIVTVLALIAGIALTWFGLGAKDHAAASYDSESWLWSSLKSEMARVNGVTGKVDTRMAVPGASGHTMQVSQSDRYMVLRDVNTGQLSAVDLTTLQTSGTAASTSGLGVTVALDGDAAFLIDPAQGLVRQINPATLAPVGDPVHFPAGITGGSFDGKGRLWIAVPSEGTVAAITPAGPMPSSGGVGGGNPNLVKTVAVADRSHDLTVSTLDTGVAVLDRTNGRLTTVLDDQQHQVGLDLQGGSGSLPTRTTGPDVPVTVVDGRHVFVVSNDTVHDFTVPGDGARLKPAVPWAGRFYVADETNSVVYVLDHDGKLTDTIDFKEARGSIDLEVRENRLFVNAPNAATARVIDDDGHVKIVNKFTDDVLGGDPPKLPPPPPPKPTIGKPGAVKNLKAVAGNTQATITWGKATSNGAAITKYMVTGNGQTFTVGAAQRSLVVTGLVNGTQYTFDVWAVNSKGEGPKRTSNTVTPSFETPDPPATVTATPKPDGTVVVTWSGANGQGHKIVRYEVTASSNGATEPVGSASGSTLTIKAGDLDYGTQYAFSVVTVNDIGVASKASPLSETVVPFTKPDAVKSLTASTVTSAAGSVKIGWVPGSDNGRAITEYDVTINGTTKKTTDVSMTWNGLGDGQTVTVSVVAVNEAGDSAVAKTTAKTLAAPVRSAENASSTASSVSVTATFTGEAATCKLTVAGQASVTDSSCANGSKLTVSVNRAGTGFSWTLDVSNAAGSYSANGSASTSAVTGTSQCNGCGTGVWEYKAHGGTIDQNNTYAGNAHSDGQSLAAVCKHTGVTINSATENNNKKSNYWVMVRDPYYLPFAYTDLSDAELSSLPDCF
ncbi:fibronectin type III domain-containing protein [Hamadaea tsunoensis]|uniref:fibronectin type III domain-containing protein n=1 Tax=Hamadaea tsunoensis TaxID=53368 RepID=UPI000425AEFB|nr:fibronectin type III domain-containing protein [Hamadaea tsunoensis]